MKSPQFHPKKGEESKLIIKYLIQDKSFMEYLDTVRITLASLLGSIQISCSFLTVIGLYVEQSIVNW